MLWMSSPPLNAVKVDLAALVALDLMRPSTKSLPRVTIPTRAGSRVSRRSQPRATALPVGDFEDAASGAGRAREVGANCVSEQSERVFAPLARTSRTPEARRAIRLSRLAGPAPEAVKEPKWALNLKLYIASITASRNAFV